MPIAFGISWKDSKKVPAQIATLLLLLALLFSALIQGSPSTAAIPGAASRVISVIVRENPGAGSLPEKAVEAAGGKVGRRIDIIDGFVADIPESAVDSLASNAAVHSVTPNRRVRFLGGGNGNGNAPHPVGEDFMQYLANGATGAANYYKNGFMGKGIGVALIDTGTVPVQGLDAPGKVIHGPDLSFESQAENLVHLDTYGHGTHMAGIIAGYDGPFPANYTEGMPLPFWGIAPEAHIISLKVGDSQGATDVSQVIAAIDWVVKHRNDPGLNIKVLNLSFGTDGTQDYRVDPLAYAAEVAWRKGIVVVVAGGNDGFGSSKLNNPAYDPFVIAVGGTDTLGTFEVMDDVLGTFSSRGSTERYPDVVAPGKSIVSLRATGGVIDSKHPNARIKERFFKGTGTSQSAAVVSGAAALIINQRPGIAPDQVKALLKSTATPLPNTDKQSQGAGLINLAAVYKTKPPLLKKVAQTWTPSTGTGSLELARGSSHLYDGDVALSGEQDIFGTLWDGNRWSSESFAETSWVDGFFNGNRWSGDTWTSDAWTGNRWSSVTWTGNRWSGNRWSDASWSGNRWSGNGWTDEAWTGNRWSSDEGQMSSNNWSNGTWGD